MTYYLTRNIDESNRIRGLEWTVTASAGGGVSVAPNRQVFVGDPTIGENHRHELVHYVLTSLTESGETHDLVTEGIATWLGGTLGLGDADLRSAYSAFVQTQASLTLDRVIDTDTLDLGRRPAGAILCRMVYDAGGIVALRELLAAGSSDAQLRSTLERLSSMSWSDVRANWRRRALDGNW